MLLREITLKSLLSFGPDGVRLELLPLNVLIGPNGSGKSNLLEAISLLPAASSYLATPIREGGGIRDWIWKGQPNLTATVGVVVENPDGNLPLRHVLKFTESSQAFQLVGERIENAEPFQPGADVYDYYRYEHGLSVASAGKGFPRERRALKEVALDQSVLSQRKDPDQYPELTYLGESYGRIRLYREWCFGRNTPARLPQKSDQPNRQLEPDASNLGLMLNRLRRQPEAKRVLLENLRQLYTGIEDYDVSIEGGTVQVFLQESGFVIPATRLSDGTLRYLCLLVILCDPSPPPLICIEEPELGLHPDLLPTMARLLKSASERTQLVVTTHSDILVDELSDQPESVVVCEKTDGQTSMRRLQPEALAGWLERYRLGQLWTRGELGGVRW